MKFELEVVRFDAVDVITTSGAACADDCACDAPPGMPLLM